MSRLTDPPAVGTMMVIVEIPPEEFREEEFALLTKGIGSLSRLYFPGAFVHHHRYLRAGWEGELGPEYSGRMGKVETDGGSTDPGSGGSGDAAPPGVVRHLPRPESGSDRRTEPPVTPSGRWGGSNARHRKE